MKKTVLTFGLISGAIMAAMMFGTMLFIRNIGFDKAEIVGYTGMVLAFLLVFFGIRSYRENVGGGTISFGRAFAVGALIMLISTACYVIAASNCRASAAADASQEAIRAQLQRMKTFKDLYNNPFFNAAITFLEPLPVGLIITLISSLILRKKDTDAGPSPSREPAQRMAA